MRPSLPPIGLIGKNLRSLSVIFFFFFVGLGESWAQVLPKLNIGFEKAKSPEDIAVTLQLIALLTILSLAPSILILMTCFTRIVVVLNFLRQALGTQQVPPNQVMMGLALILTFFVMQPTWKEINQNALQPYLEKSIDYKVALNKAVTPLREFMFRQVSEKDLAVMIKISKDPLPERPEDIATSTLLPAFVLSELRAAFIIGFLIYIPFVVIDMVVSSVLMSMGMMMLPPIMISLPFKLILFVLVDGWNLVIQHLVMSVR